MRRKIVEFEEGTFAIRKKSIFGYYQYKDLKHNGFWWGEGSNFFKDCICKSEEEIIKHFCGKKIKREFIPRCK